jgi:hypothetical protein
MFHNLERGGREMASWTIIGKGIEGDVQGKTFGLTLDTNNNKWTVGGPNVDKFFVTKNAELLNL